MKTKKPYEKGSKSSKSSAAKYGAVKKADHLVLQDSALAYALGEEEDTMIRTQIYLSRPEHRFLQQEATRQGVPMAAILRGMIEEKMHVPEEAWSHNPLLSAPVDSEFVSPEDGIVNLDHYVYGTPKKWVKHQGGYVDAPKLPEDYHTNAASAEVFNRQLNKK